MTEKTTPAATPPKKPVISTESTVKPVPTAPKKNTSVWLGIATISILSAGGVYWWEKQQVSPFQAPAKVVAQSPINGTEELNRFKIVKQELLELRNAHEALAREFVVTQKQLAELTEKTALPLPEETAEKTSPVSAAAQAENNQQIADLQNTVGILTAKIDSLQKTYDAQAAQSATRLQILQLASQIQDKLTAGETYTKEFAELRPLLGGDTIPRAAVYTLQQNAERGVPSLTDLMTDFQEITSIAIPLSIAANNTSSFGDSLRAKFGNLITIRKVDVDTDDDTDEANIARAEAELRAGNIDMTLTHLQQLTAETKALFAQWITQANHYLDTREAITVVKSLALQPTSAPAE